MDRRDLLGECNGTSAPLDLFQKECCSRCLNLECTRSIAGKSRFEQRTSTWEERLFTNVLRMDTQDSRYPQISGQKFIMVPGQSRTPEVSASWIDPLDPKESVLSSTTGQDRTDSIVKQNVKEFQPVSNRPHLRTTPDMILRNAPAQTGKILGPVPPPAPTSAPPAPKNSGERIILPGAKVKLGV